MSTVDVTYASTTKTIIRVKHRAANGEYISDEEIRHLQVDNGI
jgi:hypothetical protein